MITCNHPTCENYGYTFFKIALRAVEKLQKRQIVGMAIAIGLAFDKEGFKNFSRDL